MNANDPAFPVPPDVVGPNGENCYVRERGLTIREHMATEFLAVLIPTQITNEIFGKMCESILSKVAISYADALISELNKPATTKNPAT